MTTTIATPSSTDRIHKQVTLAAPRSRVWRAITDVKQFNAWFGVHLTSPFAPGVEASGNLTFRNYEHVTLRIWIETMQPESVFSFRWHPYAIEPAVDYSAEPTTLVTFTLEDAAGGATRLIIEESGFDAIPESRRAKACAMNTGGWNGQAENLEKFLATGAEEDGRIAPHAAAEESSDVYGVRRLVDSFRAVRENTIRLAEEIPESQYNFRPTPQSRSVAETLVHIAWVRTADHVMHVEWRLDSLEGFDFPALLATSTVEEKRARTKAEIIDLLRTEGERWASWVAQLSDDFVAERVILPGGASVNRFELLLGTKEHEMQHRAQLTVIERLLGIVPRPTGLA